MTAHARHITGGCGATHPVWTFPSRERRAHCQADHALPRAAPGGRYGTIAWAEHVEACAAGKALGLQGFRDGPERVQQRGGLGYADVVAALGRAALTWKEWGA